MSSRKKGNFRIKLVPMESFESIEDMENSTTFVNQKTEENKTSSSNASFIEEISVTNACCDDTAEFNYNDDTTEFNYNDDTTDKGSFLERYVLFRQMENARVRVPRMQMYEMKNGDSFVKVDNERIRLSLDAEKEMKSRGLKRRAPESPIKRKHVLREFNSSSTFYEEEPSQMDGLYFQVFETQLKGDDEICLSGVFVEEGF